MSEANSPPAPAPQPSPPKPGVPDYSAASPRWGALVKLLVSLVLVVLAGALLARFQAMIAPLVLAIVLTFLLRPAVAGLVARTGLTWHAAVSLVYLGLLALLIGLLAAAGIAVIEEAQELYGALAQIISPDLPTQLQHLLSAPVQLGPFLIDLTRPFTVGPFLFDPNRINWQPLYEQVLGAIQPGLRQLGVAITTLAASTAATVGWMLFILIVSFYLLFDSPRLAGSIEAAVPPAYAYDARRLMGGLAPIWTAFLRGQIILGIVMGFAVGLTMAALGVRYSLVLGLLGGFLEFLPIVGPVIAGGTAVVIALFQPGNWLGLSPVPYALVVLGASILLQQLENNFLVPRILGGSLNLNPVVILVGAVIAADLAGITGLLLSAPVLATLRLFGRYVYRKMLDLDPWPEPAPAALPPKQTGPAGVSRWLAAFSWVGALFQKGRPPSKMGGQ